MHPLVLQFVAIMAGWDAWRWYFARVSEASETAPLLALTVLLGFLGAPRMLSRDPNRKAPWLPVTVLLGLYAASYAIAPPVIRCTIAAMAAFAPISFAAFRKPPPIAFWGLVMLAMPVLPSLHFTLGYPMRVVSAALALAIMQMHGFEIAREGTFLVWGGEIVQFDAPCSGVNMLWAGLLLTLAACLLFRLNAARVVLAVVLSVAVTLVTNAFRATVLFYMEAGFLPVGPPWWHEGVGVVSFAMGAAATLWVIARLGGGGSARCPG